MKCYVSLDINFLKHVNFTNNPIDYRILVFTLPIANSTIPPESLKRWIYMHEVEHSFCSERLELDAACNRREQVMSTALPTPEEKYLTDRLNDDEDSSPCYPLNALPIGNGPADRRVAD